MDRYRLDFEQIRANACGRHKPIFPVAELEKVVADTPAELLGRKDDMVRFHAYVGFGELRLPLAQAPVRRVLKELRFSTPPQVRFGEMLVACGQLEKEAAL